MPTTDFYKNMDNETKKHYRQIFRKCATKRMIKNVMEMTKGDKDGMEESEAFFGWILERRQYWTIQQAEEIKKFMKEAIDKHGQEQYLLDKVDELEEKYTFKGERISIENNDVAEFMTTKVLEGYVVVQAKEGIMSLIEKEIGLKFIKIDDIDMILVTKKQLVSAFLIKRDDEFRKFLKNVPDDELDFEHLVLVQIVEESDKVFHLSVRHSELTKKKVRKFFEVMNHKRNTGIAM